MTTQIISHNIVKAFYFVKIVGRVEIDNKKSQMIEKGIEKIVNILQIWLFLIIILNPHKRHLKDDNTNNFT